MKRIAILSTSRKVIAVERKELTEERIESNIESHLLLEWV